MFWYVKETVMKLKFLSGGLSFLTCGFAFAFGKGSPFIGYTYFTLIDLPPERYAFFFFQVLSSHYFLLIPDLLFVQCTFAATCSTIVSGAIAERCNFNGYILFSIILTGVVYPIQTHWAWGEGGWLADT